MGKSGHGHVGRSVFSGGVAAPPPIPAQGEPVFGLPGDTLLMNEGFETYATAQLYQDHRNDGGLGVFHIASGNDQPTADGVFVTGRTGGNAWRLAFAGAAQEIHYLALYGCSDSNANPVDFNDGFSATHGLLISQFWSRVLITPALTQFEGWRIKYHMLFQRQPANIGGGGYATRIQFNTADQPVGPPFGSLWQALMGAFDTDSECQAIGPSATEMVNAGGWWRNTCAYQPNSSVGARDGLARMWINGTKIVDISKSAIGVTPNGGVKTWCSGVDVDSLGLANDSSVTCQFTGTLRWWDILTTDNHPFTCDTDDILIWNRPRIASP